MTEKLVMIVCPKCGDDFPELRKTLYNYHTCVNCSTTEPLVGITTVEGTGDHTYNDLIIMPRSRAIAIQRAADESAGKRVNHNVEILDFDNDTPEQEISQSIKDQTKALSEDGESEYDPFDPDKEHAGIQGIDY
jgi:hypothetical protein